MEIDKNAKLIILPTPPDGEHREYRIVKLPTPDLTASKPYLLQDSTVCELSTITGSNSAITLPNSNAVKSFLLEPLDASVVGAVLQSSTTTVASPFNFTYLMMSLFVTQGDKFATFKSVDDIRDTLSEISPSHRAMSEVGDAVYVRSLSLICDVITEGNEAFYRFNAGKSFEWVRGRIDALETYIAEKAGNSILKKIRAELLDPTSVDHVVESSVLQNAILCYAVDYICDSYLVADFKAQLVQHFNFDFSKMETYLAEIKSKQKKLEAVEANMNDVNVVSSNATKAAKKLLLQQQQQQQQAKKRAGGGKKVAVGKGALDGFFKRA
ncbi:uncharacterized protein LODBEIA_P34250 [Lodderomyces beijingensis]|uniref:Ribonuclease H2 subunit B n=1 Tax=Lodderomyces beijingensis TaxID=1775926 RepID=A0ABP0ZQ23_9ASCO